ncbi:PREDICTED: matrix metalloproteinase-14-like isoform X2 [Nicrophorus vespilloides]|uniref:Matrix metalloproteinase-14-like isoform X2 n=1 Tax=Nicrophorus vespilloides TaxID=110193 RepID=A0ABM1N382_NICVS|nr:PREDICTED: matrix metalloproteinase-14-like isoform X2 [Nicrophorus vespilloides]
MFVSVVLMVVLTIYMVGSAPVNDNQAMLYLSQYGYIAKTRFNSSSIMDEHKFSKAVADFQSFAGLNITGELDKETITVMSLPRCGVQDKVGTGSDSRSKRYALQGSRWKAKNLTYRISKYPKNLKQSEVDKELQKAFDVWTGYTDLNFKPATGKVHIDIRFESGEHGDGDPFDGPGGTLAHAYFPIYGGDAHFDASETWTIGSYRGTNLFQVAAHEFGHSLGLSHSDVRSALMAPFYRGYEPFFELDQDDVDGIQALYGKKTSRRVDPPQKQPKPFEPTEPSVTSDDNLCKDSSFDTIFKSAGGEVYVFKGDKYWQLSDDRVMSGYPKLITKGWPGLPGDIDAAFTYKNGKSYFFKGKQYWRYAGRKVDGDYPKDISTGFTGIPDNLDAATVWSGNGKIYFYKGTKFWRFDPMQRPPVKSGYPKPISNWEGLPDNLDAAFKDNNGYTYFFKDGAYYRFNDRTFSVDSVNPAFPRSAAYWWFGCKEAPRGTIGKTGLLVTTEESDISDYNFSDSDPNFDSVVSRLRSIFNIGHGYIPESYLHRRARY